MSRKDVEVRSCPACGAKYAGNFQWCPNCSAVLPDESGNPTDGPSENEFIGSAVFVGLVVFVVAFGLLIRDRGLFEGVFEAGITGGIAGVMRTVFEKLLKRASVGAPLSKRALWIIAVAAFAVSGLIVTCVLISAR